MAKEYTLRFTDEELRVIQSVLENDVSDRKADLAEKNGNTEEDDKLAGTEMGVIAKVLEAIGRFL